MRRVPPESWVAPAEAMVLMMLPLLALVRTSSLVGVVGVTLFALAVLVETVEVAVTEATILVPPLAVELVPLPEVPLTVLAPSLEFFTFTLLICGESLSDFGIPLAFCWPVDKPVFSSLGSCLTDIFVDKLLESEGTALAVPALTPVLPQFEGIGPFM